MKRSKYSTWNAWGIILMVIGINCSIISSAAGNEWLMVLLGLILLHVGATIFIFEKYAKGGGG